MEEIGKICMAYQVVREHRKLFTGKTFLLVKHL